jgi:hypothetical protein
MSIELVLVPAAIAAYGAYKTLRAERSSAGTVCEVQTRMRDEGLLVAALQETSARVSTIGTGILRAQWQEVTAEFTRDSDGIWRTVFTGNVDEARAVGIVQAIDTAYGRQVQRVVVQRLKERAPQAGMTVVSQTVEQDDTVMLVLDVDEVTA